MGGTTRIPLNILYSNVRQSIKKMANEQKYAYFLVLDFEATCERDKRIEYPEIIEFPVLKIESKHFNIVDQFHEYVRPVINPQLSYFCTELTGITQDVVDDSDTFSKVFTRFRQWMDLQELNAKNSLFVTCGDWDLKFMLPNQCTREGIEMPQYFMNYMNIKKAYTNVKGSFPKGMMPMIKELGLSHIGRHHSGIDDCLNIANILKSLYETGIVFESTSQRMRKELPPSNK